jgi:hypothetical protein
VWPEHSQLLEKIIECRPSVIVEHEPLTVRTAPPASLIPHGHAATEARVTLQAVRQSGSAYDLARRLTATRLQI